MLAAEQTFSTKSYADMMEQTIFSNNSENLLLNSNNLMSSSHDWKVVQKITKKISWPFLGKIKGASLKTFQMQKRPADVFIFKGAVSGGERRRFFDHFSKSPRTAEFFFQGVEGGDVTCFWQCNLL